MRASIEAFSQRVHVGITLLVNVVFMRGSVWADHRHVSGLCIMPSRRPMPCARLFLAHICGNRGEPENWSVSIVNRENNAQRHLRVGWLNVRSLASKTVAVHEAVTTNDLDVLVLTETWHRTSDDICLREAAPSDCHRLCP